MDTLSDSLQRILLDFFELGLEEPENPNGNSGEWQSESYPLPHWLDFSLMILLALSIFVLVRYRRKMSLADPLQSMIEKFRCGSGTLGGAEKGFCGDLKEHIPPKERPELVQKPSRRLDCGESVPSAGKNNHRENEIGNIADEWRRSPAKTVNVNVSTSSKPSSASCPKFSSTTAKIMPIIVADEKEFQAKGLALRRDPLNREVFETHRNMSETQLLASWRLSSGNPGLGRDGIRLMLVQSDLFERTLTLAH